MNDLLFSIKKNYLSYLPAFLASICLLIIALYIDHQNTNTNKQKAYNTLLNKVSIVRARIEGSVNSNTQVVKGLIAAISVEPDMSHERFVALTTPLLTGHSQIRNIAAAPDLVIRYMNPVAGNEAAIGLDYRTLPDQYDAVKRVLETGDLVLDGPVDLVQGGQGLIARIPVFIESEDQNKPDFWGIISSVIDIEKFFTVSGLYDKNLDFDIAIRGHRTPGKQPRLIFGDDTLFNLNPVITDITLPYGSWEVAAVPDGGWQQGGYDVLIYRTKLFALALVILIPLIFLGRYIQKKRDSEAFLRLLFKVSPMGIALNDYDTGDFIEVSDVLLENTGYTSDEFLQLNYWDITPEKYKTDEALQLQSLEQTGQYGPYEKEYIRKDGSHFPVILKGMKIVDSSGKELIWSFVEDISKRKQTEQSLQRSQKMEAIGQLTGGIAHDFNNIMGIILGNLELLKPEISSNPDSALNRVDNIYKAGQRAADLTKQLLSFSSNKPSKQEVININNLIDTMQNLISRSVTPEIEVEVELTNDLWLTKINPGEFEDAILNLCLNARDAMNDHGKLSITTQNKMLDDAFCESITDVNPGEYVEVTVSDSGTGIKEEQVERIFEPFFTTKEEGKGTGLGLAMVYGFVQRSNGFIEIKSKEGVGTIVKLYLPRSCKDEQSDVEVVHKAPSRGSETVLVVDDEIMLLELAGTLLEELGYRVITATNGKEALEKLNHESGIDLLFTDVIMPGGINGFELVEKAMHDFPNLKVLITSGHIGKAMNNDTTVIQSVKENILKKPYTKNELAVEIRTILDKTL